uniref:Spondin-like TSP1 domain-containing protein n=1 Tax=Ciona savignyi TaxID=51511 RepID=H2Y5M7_CIOSA
MIFKLTLLVAVCSIGGGLSMSDQRNIVSLCQDAKNCEHCPGGYEMIYVDGCAVCSCTPPVEVKVQGPARWSRWSRWSECDKPCNFGSKTRVRRCINGVVGTAGCVGPVEQSRRCKNKNCPLYRGGECYDPLAANEYRGKVKIARRGVRCFRWNHPRSA